MSQSKIIPYYGKCIGGEEQSRSVVRKHLFPVFVFVITSGMNFLATVQDAHTHDHETLMHACLHDTYESMMQQIHYGPNKGPGDSRIRMRLEIEQITGRDAIASQIY